MARARRTSQRPSCFPSDPSLSETVDNTRRPRVERLRTAQRCRRRAGLRCRPIDWSTVQYGHSTGRKVSGRGRSASGEKEPRRQVEGGTNRRAGWRFQAKVELKFARPSTIHRAREREKKACVMRMRKSWFVYGCCYSPIQSSPAHPLACLSSTRHAMYCVVFFSSVRRSKIHQRDAPPPLHLHRQIESGASRMASCRRHSLMHRILPFPCLRPTHPIRPSIKINPRQKRAVSKQAKPAKKLINAMQIGYTSGLGGPIT